MLDLLILIVILGAVTYRVGRLIALDTLWEGTRDKLLCALTKIEVDGVKTCPSPQNHYEFSLVPVWRRKLYELLTCPFCVTAYVSAGACLLTRIFAGSFAMPVWVWLGAWTMGLVFWAVIDSDS